MTPIFVLFLNTLLLYFVVTTQLTDRQMKLIRAVLVILMFLGTFVPFASAQTLGQIGHSVNVSIESGVGDVVQTSFDSHTVGVELDGMKWKPSGRTLNIGVSPVKKLTASVMFDISGGIDDQPRTVRPVTGLLEGIPNLSGFVGSSKHWEALATYHLLSHLDISGGNMKYGLDAHYEYFYPTSFGGGGYTTTYDEHDTWQGLMLGAGSHFRLDKVGLEPSVIYYPSISRHFQSHQFYLGQVADNNSDLDDISTHGFRLSGKITYDLTRNLMAQFGYNYALWNSEGVKTICCDSDVVTQQFTVRGGNFGLRVRF